MGDRIFTSEAAEETLKHLQMLTNMEFGALARLALALSLKHVGAGVPRSPDARGKEIRDRSLFGPDMTVYRALIQQVHGRRFEDEDEFISRDASVVKDHVDHGCSILQDMLDAVGEDKGEFFARLSDELEAIERAVTPLSITVGAETTSNSPLQLAINNMREHPNPHMAIMGKSGVGKTQVLLKILADIRELSNKQTHFLLFDYKGDIAANERFLGVTGARLYRLPEDRLPINPFILERYDEDEVMMAARAKSASFGSAQSKLGVVQKGKLTEGVVEAYRRRQSAELPYPDLREVLELVEARYEAEGQSADALIEILRDLANFGLFWQHGWNEPVLDRITDTCMVIDLSRLPVLRELADYIVIEQLYREMSALPDSPLADPYRSIRTVLVIDEAHHYLGHKNIFLQRVLREGRSKGVAVFLASQSPSDYVQRSAEFDYAEHMEFPLVFGCDGISSRATRELLGCSERDAKALPTEIARLQPFEFITKADDRPEGYVTCRAHPFYEASGG